MPDGSVLVVDSLKRLVLLDSNLAFRRVLVDSVPSRIRPRWTTTGFLIPVKADEAWYVDGIRPMYSRVVGDSVVASNVALPRPDLTFPAWIDNMGGRPAFDTKGRLVYAALRTILPVYAAVGDSAWLFGIDPEHPPMGDNRLLPVAAFVAVGQFRHVDSRNQLHPVLPNDLWAVVGDAVVVLRANGAVIEKWSVDGARVATATLPRDPRVIGAAQKQHIVDSVRSGAMAYQAEHPEETVATNLVAASALPDTLPAFRGDAPVVDPAGRLWVIESPLYSGTDSTTALVIDVTGDFGRVIERRVLPPGAKIAAVGANSIYLWRFFGPLERVRLNR
jgi:hypothetical protein